MEDISSIDEEVSSIEAACSDQPVHWNSEVLRDKAVGERDAPLFVLHIDKAWIRIDDFAQQCMVFFEIPPGFVSFRVVPY
jgi:hypothetical protein